MTQPLRKLTRTVSSRESGKGGGEIGRSRADRCSRSVYLSDDERDILREFAHTHNLSKAIQYLTRALQTLQKRK